MRAGSLAHFAGQARAKPAGHILVGSFPPEAAENRLRGSAAARVAVKAMVVMEHGRDKGAGRHDARAVRSVTVKQACVVQVPV